MRCAHNFFNPPAVRWPFLSPSFHPNVKIFHNAHPISLVSYPIDNQDVSHTCHFAFQNRPFHRPKRTFSRSQTDLFRVSNGLFRNCVNIFHKFLTRHINNSRRVILPHDQRTNKLIRSFDRPDNNKRRPRKLITEAAFILMTQATLDHNSNSLTTNALHTSSVGVGFIPTLLPKIKFHWNSLPQQLVEWSLVPILLSSILVRSW